MRQFLPLTLALIALAACGEATSSPSAGAVAPQVKAARDAAEVALRARLRQDGAPQQRGIQVFTQALPAEFVVCGRSRIAGLGGEPFIPYVAVVRFEAGAAQVSQFALGSTSVEASRVFVLMVDRCFDGGGPGTTRVTARAFPPMPPDGAAETSVLAGQASTAPSATMTEIAAEPSPGPIITVVTTSRSGANIRSSGRGGDVVRTVPAATRLDVIGSPAGDWVQVGSGGTAWGWIHNSMLDGPAR